MATDGRTISLESWNTSRSIRVHLWQLTHARGTPSRDVLPAVVLFDEVVPATSASITPAPASARRRGSIRWLRSISRRAQAGGARRRRSLVRAEQ